MHGGIDIYIHARHVNFLTYSCYHLAGFINDLGRV